MPKEEESKEEIQIGLIREVSPSLAELLRACKLRAGLSRAEGARPFVLGNPKAWLGTAYHEVLAVAGACKGEELGKVIGDTWEAVIDRQYQRARNHPLDKRYGKPETWPGYHMIAAMAQVRAQELATAQRNLLGEGTDGEKGPGVFREQNFSGACGRIVGRPDVVRGGEIVDFKSGEVHEEEGQHEIRSSYVRQLRLYAFLAKETLGCWPRRGLLLPMAGLPIQVALEPQECEREADEAVQLLEDYNALLCKAVEPSELATPSPATCRWCAFQIICPAFWKAVGRHWANELPTAVLTGVVCEPPRFLHGGTAFSIAVMVQRGTRSIHNTIELYPLDACAFPAAANGKKGDVIRITGMLQCADGTVRVTKRTIMANVSGLPWIAIHTQAV